MFSRGIGAQTSCHVCLLYGSQTVSQTNRGHEPVNTDSGEFSMHIPLCCRDTRHAPLLSSLCDYLKDLIRRKGGQQSVNPALPFASGRSYSSLFSSFTLHLSSSSRPAW